MNGNLIFLAWFACMAVRLKCSICILWFAFMSGGCTKSSYLFYDEHVFCPKISWPYSSWERGAGEPGSPVELGHQLEEPRFIPARKNCHQPYGFFFFFFFSLSFFFLSPAHLSRVGLELSPVLSSTLRHIWRLSTTLFPASVMTIIKTDLLQYARAAAGLFFQSSWIFDSQVAIWIADLLDESRETTLVISAFSIFPPFHFSVRDKWIVNYRSTSLRDNNIAI